MATVGILEAIVLGIIQGLTEWLPISSSGHLALAQLALNLEVPVFYDLVLHLGTLAGVFVVYGKEISCMLRSVVNQKTAEAPYPQGKRMLWLIILGTVPTAIIGLTFRSFFEYSFYDPLSISIGFIVTGILLLATKFLKPGNKKLGQVDAILIGVGQGASIFSSLSRSGATIAVGMFRGVEKEQLVRYSFLLSIPAIVGAALIDAISIEGQDLGLANIGIESYLVGMAISAVVGYISIRILIRAVVRGRFHLFALYCFAAGIATLIIL
ncbi:MAG TPA: undecaprenyl-diphosphate phosphatase [Nitrososphaera sp.]